MLVRTHASEGSFHGFCNIQASTIMKSGSQRNGFSQSCGRWRFSRVYFFNDTLRDCSGRSGKGAYKVEGSVRLLLPLHEDARKGMFVYVDFFVFLLPVSISWTDGTTFYCGEKNRVCSARHLEFQQQASSGEN